MSANTPQNSRSPDGGWVLSGSHKRMHLAANIAHLGFYELDIPTDTAVWENDRVYEMLC